MRVDLASLRSEAERTRHGEAYYQVVNTSLARVGVGLRLDETTETFIEVAVPLCTDGTIELDDLEVKVRLLRLLRSQGYTLNCRDDGVDCEKIVPENELEAELDSLRLGD